MSLGVLQALLIRPNDSLGERIGLALRLLIHRQVRWQATSDRCLVPVGRRLGQANRWRLRTAIARRLVALVSLTSAHEPHTGRH